MLENPFPEDESSAKAKHIVYFERVRHHGVHVL